MRARISQREAHRLKKRVESLERQHAAQVLAWTRDYIGGVNIANATLDEVVVASLRTARRLGFAVVVTVDWNGNAVAFHAAKAGE